MTREAKAMCTRSMPEWGQPSVSRPSVSPHLYSRRTAMELVGLKNIHVEDSKVKNSFTRGFKE